MSTSVLKYIAVICMLMDHMETYIDIIPEWFSWVGRLAMPLFAFCLAQGMYYTHDRKKYLTRLYVASVSMAALNCAASFRGVHIESNVFATLFSSSMLICLIDYIRAEKRGWKKILYVYIAVQILEIIILLVIELVFGIGKFSFLIMALGGNLFVVDGGLIAVLLPVLIYYNGYTKRKLAVTYVGWYIGYIVLCVSGLPYRFLRAIPEGFAKNVIEIMGAIVLRLDIMDSLRTIDYRVFVIFALPFMLLYNNKRGRYNKYFFYVFYPIHIYALYFISKLI